MAIDINQEKDLYNSLVKCKISGNVKNVVIDKNYGNCIYKLKIYLENSWDTNFYFDKNYSLPYYTTNFSSKNCDFKSITKEIKMWSKVNIIVDAENDYTFLKNTNEDNNNNILNSCIYNRNNLNDLNYSYNNIFYWIIIILSLIIIILISKLKQKSNS
mgnify:CR=1 FL=1